MKQLLIKCNVGSIERKYRFILGAAALGSILRTKDKSSKYLLGALGSMGVATATSRYCPLYHLLGINRCQPAYRAFPHLLRRL
jgi:hypothetical protein